MVSAVSIDALRSDLGLVLIAVLMSLVSLGVLVEIALFFFAGPRSYVVGPDGLWFGRGSRTARLFEWSEVVSWTGSSAIQGGRRWKFKTREKVFTVRAADIAVPSAETFAHEVEERLGKPPAEG